MNALAMALVSASDSVPPAWRICALTGHAPLSYDMMPLPGCRVGSQSAWEMTAALRAQPQIADQARFVDYADFLPGGVGLRVFPRADGFKTFLVLPGRPESNIFSLAIDAPGLTVSPEDEFGNYVFLDEQGSVVGRLPRPFMLDSSVLESAENEGRGGGEFSDAVTQSVTQQGEGWLLTLTVDIPAILRLGPKLLAMYAATSASIMLGGVLAFLAMRAVFPETMGGDTWGGMAALAGSWSVVEIVREFKP